MFCAHAENQQSCDEQAQHTSHHRAMQTTLLCLTMAAGALRHEVRLISLCHSQSLSHPKL